MTMSSERKLTSYAPTASGGNFKGAGAANALWRLLRAIAPLLALCIGLVTTFAPPASAGPTGLAGTWDTNWGQLVVYAENDRYFGHYVPSSGATDDTGDVTFVPSGGALTGYWVEPNANERCNITKMGTYYWGRVVLDQPITSDGFAVKWGYCANGPLDRVWTFNHKTSEPTNAGAGAGTSAQTDQVAKPPSEDAPEPTELGASSAGNTPTPSGTGQGTGVGADGKPKPSSEDGFKDVVTDLTSLGFQPIPSSAGSPDTEVKIGHLEVVTIGMGPSIDFSTLRRSYILSEDERSSSHDAGNDVQAVDKFGGFAYLDFSTDGNDDAMTALAGENGIDCTSEAKRPRLDGNVFSYQLNFHQAYNDQAISYECLLDLVGVINPNGKSVSLWLKYKGLQLSWVNDFNRPDRWDWIKNTEVSYKITDLPLSSATQFDNYACLTFSADSLASRHYVKITDIYEQERSYYPHPGTDIQPIDTPEDLMVRQPMQIWWSADPSEPDTGIKVELCGAP